MRRDVRGQQEGIAEDPKQNSYPLGAALGAAQKTYQELAYTKGAGARVCIHHIPKVTPKVLLQVVLVSWCF